MLFFYYFKVQNPLVMEGTNKPSIISFAKDLPNIVSLLALLSTLFGIYFAIAQQFQYAIIGIVWAVLFDWLDGFVARRMQGRTLEQSNFGAQLDSQIDIVSFGVLPALILLSYGKYSWWLFPGAFIIIAGCALRLSYFNIYGLSESKMYTGLPADHNGMLVAFVFLFEQLLSQDVFTWVYYVVLLVIFGLNVSSIQYPKYSKNGIYWIALYVVVVTGLMLI